MRALKSELQESSATEPAIITNAAASIVAANGLVQHQFNDIRRVLDSKKEEIATASPTPKVYCSRLRRSIARNMRTGRCCSRSNNWRPN